MPLALPMMLQCRHSQEFSFGPRALKDALISTNPALQELYAKTFSSTEKLFLSEAYNPQRALFSALQIRTAFDWLISHPDAPEDFEAFYYSFLQKKRSCYRKHIYLQPIDPKEGAVSLSLLDSLSSCTESFFMGLSVKCLPSIPISSIDCHVRQNQASDREQIHADSILNYLKKNKPVDALCVLALTLNDLYPRETWNYTFGKSLLEQDVGVCSFARFSNDFPQVVSETIYPSAETEETHDVALSERDGTLTFGVMGIIQCCKVTCHEISLLIGLGTCRWLSCLMQGAMSLDELLLRPPELCPICLRKLHYVLGFKLVERYKKLLAWTETVLPIWAGQSSDDPSMSDDILPLSSDSGVCCENESELLTSISDPLSPDTCSHIFSIGHEMEHSEQLCSLEDMSSQQVVCVASETTDFLKKYQVWLEHCVTALEREVSEEELSAVDRGVDVLTRWDMFTGELPLMKKELQFTRYKAGLRRALGDKFSSLRRKLSSRRLTNEEDSPT